ncbi:Fpg/Nei family DNA glycosylase [Nocardioides donggukensis]|uniref:DNA-(apurinic or apyrimidinic site) lyase n=1 Tax=Nocardioides donggukensis TaxID=2774019 RepID=A0A927Q1A2_9ACTN|nr:Fpg/Nei family DNA glycosylase [Nocardioides donggukensis]MBD8869837.1 Fpg/Nei family DNA glycosylase [Nocardioides donggukensis]
MPEGDTVWRTARSLDQALSGATLTGTDFRVPELATVDLAGQVVHETLARGKHLLTRIGDDVTLHTHLKMEGSWHLYRPESAWRRPAHEARILLRTPRWKAVGFALGIVELLPRDAEADTVGHLGPDLLGPDWRAGEALARLRVDGDRALVQALLDQRNLAGLGNLYANELCFLAGVHPTTPVSSVPRLDRLVDRARVLLEANKERSAQTTTGNLRHGHQHWVYRRDRKPCLRCGQRIRVEMTGAPGRERATYWCPRCQPA